MSKKRQDDEIKSYKGMLWCGCRMGDLKKMRIEFSTAYINFYTVSSLCFHENRQLIAAPGIKSCKYTIRNSNIVLEDKVLIKYLQQDQQYNSRSTERWCRGPSVILRPPNTVIPFLVCSSTSTRKILEQ